MIFETTSNQILNWNYIKRTFVFNQNIYVSMALYYIYKEK